MLFFDRLTVLEFKPLPSSHYSVYIQQNIHHPGCTTNSTESPIDGRHVVPEKPI